jgi:hypothetical protein
MIWAMRPVPRRTFVLSLLIMPMSCLGCGGDGVTVNTAVGEKRSQKMEDFRKRAYLKRQSTKETARSR